VKNLVSTVDQVMKGLCLLVMAVPSLAQADVIDFHFTGNLVVVSPAPDTSVIYNSGSPITPISADLKYDTVNGIGSSNLSITMPDFINSPATFHNISLAYGTGNTILGSILVDWAGNYDMPMNIEWDATGLLNAINYGLAVNDVISGNILTKAATGEQIDVFSSVPYSDSILSDIGYSPLEGPAPLAATANSLGLGYDINGNYSPTPFDGIRGLINIGSGNSLIVTSITAVPVPDAVWLFCSGLIGMAGVVLHKKTTCEC
jgi:hypothetical protein